MSNTSQAELLKICREITEELRQYPGAQLFNEPVNSENQQHYLKKIKNPQDLGKILDRLKRGEYNEVKTWEKDVNTVFQNAEIYNGKDSFVSVIAHHMAEHFKVLKKRLDTKKISGWMKFLYLSREKLDRLLLSPPSGVGPIFPIRRAPSPSDYAPFSSRELDCLVQASHTGYNKQDLLQITKILMIDDAVPNGQEDLEVNVDKLSPKTLHMLKDFFKKKLHQMNLEYPI